MGVCDFGWNGDSGGLSGGELKLRPKSQFMSPCSDIEVSFPPPLLVKEFCISLGCLFNAVI